MKDNSKSVQKSDDFKLNISNENKFNFKNSEKTCQMVVIKRREDFLKYTTDQLKSIGVLVQHRSYKKPKELPLKHDKTLKVEIGQRVTFYKQGKLILLCTNEKLYDPQVQPQHISSIFKDYSEDEILANDFNDTETKVETKKCEILDKKCPLCMKNFGQNEQKLIEHAANCNGIEENSMETCPICEREFPPESLAVHAPECAQEFYD